MKSLHSREGALPDVGLLVVEDDFLLRTEMSEVLRDAGVDTVYACGTIGEALAVLDHCEVAGAVLDVRVGSESIAPVARRLVRQGTPFLFYTGQITGDRTTSEWPDSPVLSKPSRARLIVETLADLLKRVPSEAAADRRT